MGPGSGVVPVVVALLAVMLQVGDVMVISVGVVAATFTSDQPFDVTRCPRGVPAALCLNGLSSLRLLGLVPAPALDPVPHHHLADAVSAKMFHKLLLALSLEVARFTVKRFLLLGALVGGRAVFVFGVLLRGFGSGWRVGLSALRQVFSLVPIVVLVVSYDYSVDPRARRLGVLDDTELSVVLVVKAVPARHTGELTHRKHSHA